MQRRQELADNAVVDLVVAPLGGFVRMMLEDYVYKRFAAAGNRIGHWGRARFLRVAVKPGVNRDLLW